MASGSIKQAKAMLEEMNALPPVTGLTLTGGYALAAIPARYATELGDWEQASHLSVQEEGVLWAQGVPRLPPAVRVRAARGDPRAGEATAEPRSLLPAAPVADV